MKERRKKKFSAQKHDEEDKDKATSAHMMSNDKSSERLIEWDNCL